MKNQILLFLILFVCINGYSQIRFEKGYFITDDDQKIECLIRNVDWWYNPTRFDYKLTDTSQVQTADIGFVKEFGINNVSKYVRAHVKMDRSSEQIAKMDTIRSPVFHEETLFLKILVYGEAKLFVYRERGLERFFYQTPDSDINQLIYKPFLISKRRIGYNNRFRQQLLVDLLCHDILMDDIVDLNYGKKDLVSLFIDYNTCRDSDYINFDETRKKDLINLTLRLGVNRSSLAVYDAVINSKYVEFDPLLSFRLGLEAEFILPFHKNKWAVIFEPTFQSFKTQKEINNRIFVSDYKSIELPAGIRHYFYFTERSKVFINASFIWDVSMNSTLQFGTWSTREISTFENYALGLGYKYNDFSIEFRYHTPRDFMEKYLGWYSEYKTVSLILGYSFY